MSDEPQEVQEDWPVEEERPSLWARVRPVLVRWLRRLRTLLLRLAAGSIVLVAAVLLFAYSLVQNQAVAEFAVERALPPVNDAIPGTIKAGGLEGQLGRHLILTDVEILDERGVRAAFVPRIEILWNLWDLARMQIDVQEVIITEPDVLVQVREDGTVNWVGAFVAPNPDKAPKPKKQGKGESPLNIDVRSVRLTGGKVQVELPKGGPFAFEGIELDAGYQLDGLTRHEAALKDLRATTTAPWDLGEVQLSGDATLNDLDLALRDIAVAWKDNRVRVDGDLAPLNELAFATDVQVERFELADLAAFAPGLALQSAVAADLRVEGPLSDFGATGWITTDGGGRIDVTKTRLVLPTADQAMIHEADLVLANVDPGEIPGAPDLPKLTGDVGWIGMGTGPDTLEGEARVALKRTEFRGLPIDTVDVVATLDGLDVDVPRLAVELGGGRIAGTAKASVPDRTFATELSGRILDLSALATISAGAVTAGTADLEVTATGSWGGEHAVAVATNGRLSSTGLQVPQTAIGRVDIDWDIALTAGEGLPAVDGPVTVAAVGVDAAGQAIQAIDLTAALADRGAAFELRADRGEVHLELDAHVDWGAAPDITLTGDRLLASLPDWELETPSGKGFGFALDGGAIRLTDLTLNDAVGAELFARADYDPKGPVDALVRVRGFDLGRVDTVLAAFDVDPVGIQGRAKQIQVQLTEDLKDPHVQVDVALRDVEGFDRPPQNLDVALVAKNGGVSGTVGVDKLIALRIGKLPLSLRLDGKRAPAELAPKGEWDVDLDIVPGELKGLEPLIGASLPETLVAGNYDGGVQIAGITLDPEVRAAVSLSDVGIADRRLNARVGAQLAAGELTFNSTQLKTAEEGTILSVRGQAKTQLGELLLSVLGPESSRPAEKPLLLEGLGFTVDLRAVPMNLVHVFAPPTRPLTGALRGKIQIAGSLVDPQIDANLSLLDGKVGRFELERTDLLTASLSGGALRGGLDLRAKDGGAVGVQFGVSLPLSLQPMTPIDELLGQEDLEVSFTSEDFPLGVPLAFVPGMYDVTGGLRLDGSITGSLKAPVPDVRLTIAGADACYETTSICYRDLQLDTKVLTEGGPQNLRLQVGRLTTTAEPQVFNPIDRVGRPVNQGQLGAISANGYVKLVDFKPQDVHLDVQLGQQKQGRVQGFWAMFTEEIQFQLVGGLSVDGTYPALLVRGDLDVNNVNVDLGQDDTSLKIEPMLLPDELRVHRTDSRRGPGEQLPEEQQEGFEPKPSPVKELLTASDIDVSVELTNNVKVKLNVGLLGKGKGALDALNAIGNIAPDLVLSGGARLRIEPGSDKILLTGGIETIRGSTLTVLTKKFKLDDGSGVTFIGDPLSSQLGLEADFVTADSGTVSVVVSGPVAAPEIEFTSDSGYDQADIMSILLTGKPISELNAAEGQTVFSQVANGLTGFLTNALGKYAPVDSLDVDFGDDATTGTAELGKAITPYLFVSTRIRWGADDDENIVEGQVDLKPTSDFQIEVYVGDKLKGAVEVTFKLRY